MNSNMTREQRETALREMAGIIGARGALRTRMTTTEAMAVRFARLFLEHVNTCATCNGTGRVAIPEGLLQVVTVDKDCNVKFGPWLPDEKDMPCPKCSGGKGE